MTWLVLIKYSSSFSGVVSLSVILSSTPLFGWREYAYIPVQSFCFGDWGNHLSYAIFILACCFGEPCSVMTFCNIFIYRAVCASRRKVAISIPEASSVIIECEIDNKHVFRDSESMTRSASDCNSENKLIGNNEIVKSENVISYDKARNYNSTKADAAECIEAENNNIETRDKIKIKNNKFLRPLWKTETCQRIKYHSR